MHRALAVDDILCLTLDNIYGNDGAPIGSKRDLVPLARVCKLFSWPCISRIWADLPSIYPLLDLLPPSMDPMIGLLLPSSSEAGRQTQNPNVYLQVKTTRFDLYRTLVKSVCLDYTPNLFSKGIVSHHTLLLKKVSFITDLTEPLLPRLRQLKVNIGDQSFSQEIQSLLTESLQQLVLAHKSPTPNLHGGRVRSGVSHFLNLLPSRCPNLQSIQITGEIVDSDLQSVVVQVMNKLPCLTGISLIDAQRRCTASVRLTPIIFNALARFPRLTTLAISSDWAKSFVPAPLAFDTLHNLEIRGNVATTVDCIRLMTAPALQSLCIVNTGMEDRIRARDTSPRESIPNVISGIVRKFSRLTSLDLRLAEFNGNTSSLQHGLVFDVSSFGPLVDCHALTQVRIEIKPRDRYDYLMWSDADLSAFAQSWPDLQSLELSIHHVTSRPRITLGGLMALVQHCRALRRLVLSVDMKHFQWPAVMCQPARAFETLVLGRQTVISQNDAVKRYIRAMWPNTTVRLCSPPFGGYSDGNPDGIPFYLDYGRTNTSQRGQTYVAYP